MIRISCISGALTTALHYLLMLTLSSCATSPSWIHEAAPDPGYAAGSLTGAWERLAPSKYSVMNPNTVSFSREWIEINRLSYVKTHLYTEISGGQKKSRGYREKGSLKLSGRSALFQPVSAEYANSGSRAVLFTGAAVNEEEKRIVEIDELQFEPGRIPAPLLYFVDSHKAVLTPLAYERMGIIYDFGIYEGSRREFDFSSPEFRSTLADYNEKRYAGHGYALKSHPFRPEVLSESFQSDR